MWSLLIFLNKPIVNSIGELTPSITAISPVILIASSASPAILLATEQQSGINLYFVLDCVMATNNNLLLSSTFGLI